MRPLQRLLAVALLASLSSCVRARDDARASLVVSVLSRSGRPPAPTARVARGPYEFYRGTLALFAHDWRDPRATLSRSRFPVGHILTLSLGDAHPENFGTLRASDGSLALEPNDFDAAGRAPCLWDLRRLVAGLSLAARLAHHEPRGRATALAVARAAAEAYVTTLRALAEGGPRARVTREAPGAILGELFERAERADARRSELDALTVVTSTGRRLRRGALDPDDPGESLGQLPPEALATLPAALSGYRATLRDAPSEGFFTLLDAARVLGSGVGSSEGLRALALVRGPTDAPDDDVVLELKELSGMHPGAGVPGQGFASPRERVEAARAAWARPDAEPLWGATSWLGLTVQVRAERAAHKSVRVARMTGPRARPEALVALAGTLGGLLARVHATPSPGTEAGPARAITEALSGDEEGFVREQAEEGVRYADVVLDDWRRFRRSLGARR